MEENNLRPSEKPTKLYCTQCGKENQIDSKFCYNCGKELIINETEEIINEIIPEKDYKEYTLDELKILAKQDYDRFYKIAKIYYEKDHEYYVNNIRSIINERNEKKVNFSKPKIINKPLTEKPKSIFKPFFIVIGVIIVISLAIVLLKLWISGDNPDKKGNQEVMQDSLNRIKIEEQKKKEKEEEEKRQKEQK